MNGHIKVEIELGSGGWTWAAESLTGQFAGGVAVSQVDGFTRATEWLIGQGDLPATAIASSRNEARDA